MSSEGSPFHHGEGVRMQYAAGRFQQVQLRRVEDVGL